PKLPTAEKPQENASAYASAKRDQRSRNERRKPRRRRYTATPQTAPRTAVSADAMRWKPSASQGRGRTMTVKIPKARPAGLLVSGGVNPEPPSVVRRETSSRTSLAES